MTLENEDVLDVTTQEESDVTQQQEQKAAPQNDDLRDALKELTGHVNKLAAPKPKEDAPMSEAEMRKQFNVFDPNEADPKFFHDFFGLDESSDPNQLTRKQQLFAKMQEGMMRQAVTAARYLLAQERKQIDEQYGPLQEYVSQARARETRESFNQAYPALSDPRFEKVIKAQATILSQSGTEYKSQDEFFKALAEGAADTIKAVMPDFDLGASAATTKTKPGTMPKLPRGSVGGTGGAGGSGTPPKKVGNAADDIFDM